MRILAFTAGLLWLLLPRVQAAPPARIAVHAERPRQEFQGLGCGVIYFEGHVTSLAARGKDARQGDLYDDMFGKVNARYLQLMIRPEHEPEGFNSDPWSPKVDPANFKCYASTLAIAKAARQRRPDIELFATLYSPPAWMKTNNSTSGGGEAKATLKPGMELAFAEYLWVFLAHMARNGCPIKYLAIANECDWPHTQIGCYFTPADFTRVFKTVGQYLEKMAAKYPDVPRPLLVAPNSLGAPSAVERFIPALNKTAGRYLAVLAAHDYDPRGDRWGDMRRIARGRPVWMTEWCARDPDASPGKINSAIWYASMMHDAFSGGANVWMAYDWIYPPKKGGESLIRVDWGRDYVLEKPYWVFRQWAAPLSPACAWSRANRRRRASRPSHFTPRSRAWSYTWRTTRTPRREFNLWSAACQSLWRRPKGSAPARQRTPWNCRQSPSPAADTPTRCRRVP